MFIPNNPSSRSPWRYGHPPPARSARPRHPSWRVSEELMEGIPQRSESPRVMGQQAHIPPELGLDLLPPLLKSSIQLLLDADVTDIELSCGISDVSSTSSHSSASDASREEIEITDKDFFFSSGEACRLRGSGRLGVFNHLRACCLLRAALPPEA